MRYLIVALINAIYGILLLIGLKSDTSGFYLVLFIALVLTTVGLIGIGLWLYKTITSTDKAPSAGMRSWYQIAKGVDVLLVIGLLFRALILQPFVVDGSSMETNYHNQEFLLVDKVSYRFTQPKRGEVIIFQNPRDKREDYIKRVIALPGETLEIKNGQVFINGQLLNENYLGGKETYVLNSGQPYKKILGSNEYFVMGDNRNNSSDSREWGGVPKTNIIGRSWFVVYPLTYFGKVQNIPASFSNISALVPFNIT